jgi:inosine/xanthosine triphosphatase
MTFDFARIRQIVVGSTNPVKVSAVRAVVGRVAPGAMVSGVAVPSGVPDQPWGDAQTIEGALTRARLALGHALAHGGVSADAALGVGVEGGVVEEADGSLRTCAWAAIVDSGGRTGVGGSLAMPLPPRVAALIRDGAELGHAMDAVSRGVDTKRGPGAVGILTGGLMDRQRAYEPLVVYALSRFVGADFWEEPGSP